MTPEQLVACGRVTDVSHHKTVHRKLKRSYVRPLVLSAIGTNFNRRIRTLFGGRFPRRSDGTIRRHRYVSKKVHEVYVKKRSYIDDRYTFLLFRSEFNLIDFSRDRRVSGRDVKPIVSRHRCVPIVMHNVKCAS